MLKYLKIALVAATLVASGTVFALELQDAKNAGWLGEQRDGYLGMVSPSAPAEARKLMAEVNEARRRSYREIAGKTGAELRAVEVLAAEKALQKTQPGNSIQAADGSWIRK